MKTRSKQIAVVAACVWVAVMIASVPTFIAAHREKRAAITVFDQYAAALVNRDYLAAYQLCDDEFRRATPFQDFEGIYATLVAKHGRLLSVQTKTYEVTGRGNPFHWQATVEANLVYNQRTVEFRFGLRRDGGRWALHGSEESQNASLSQPPRRQGKGLPSAFGLTAIVDGTARSMTSHRTAHQNQTHPDSGSLSPSTL